MKQRDRERERREKRQTDKETERQVPYNAIGRTIGTIPCECASTSSGMLVSASLVSVRRSTPMHAAAAAADEDEEAEEAGEPEEAEDGTGSASVC